MTVSLNISKFEALTDGSFINASFLIVSESLLYLCPGAEVTFGKPRYFLMNRNINVYENHTNTHRTALLHFFMYILSFMHYQHTFGSSPNKSGTEDIFLSLYIKASCN